jgi:GT2 family glycosyltransferase
MPAVSVIIANCNGKGVLVKALESVFNTTYPNLQVIVVDNHSSDGSDTDAERIFSGRKNFTLVKLNSNLKYSGANNAGFAYSLKCAKYLAFLNNDTMVNQQWLLEIIRVMENDPSIGASQPVIMTMRNPREIDSAGLLMTPYGETVPAKLSPPLVREVFYAHGAAIIVPKKVFATLGGFRTYFRDCCEETDLCWRIWLHGLRVVCIPRKLVYHSGGWTLNRLYGRTGSPPKLLTRFKLDMMLLNYSPGSVIRNVPIAILGMLIDALASAAKGALEGHPREALRGFSIFLGIVLAISDLPYVIRNRPFVQTRIRKVTDEALLARAFIRPFTLPRSVRMLLTLSYKRNETLPGSFWITKAE